MGGPCDILIAPAILYENPNGLSFEDFYFQTKKVSEKVGPGDLDWWSKNKYFFARYILNVPLQEGYKELNKSNFDKNFNDYKERFFSDFEGCSHVIKKDFKVLEEKLKFNVSGAGCSEKHKGYSAGDHLDFDDKTYWVKEIPDKYREDQNVVIQITSILKQGKPYLVDYEKYEIDQFLEGRAIKVNAEEEVIISEEKFAKKYPQYSLENVCDFSQEKGFLFPSTEEGTKDGLMFKGKRLFVWERKNENYFLSRNHMLDSLSPNSVYGRDARDHHSAFSHIDNTNWGHKGNGGIYSFTDLVMTIEAIRQKNWKILGYTGNRSQLLKFLYNNLDVFAAYEKAVWDTEFSLKAKKEGWTHFEFLRNYHEREHFRKRLDLKIAKKDLEDYVAREHAERRKYHEKWLKELEKNKKNDLPF